jgi:hypothetical protein
MTLTLRKLMAEDADEILQVYRQSEGFLALGPEPNASHKMVMDDLRISGETGGRFCGILNADGTVVGVIDFVSHAYQDHRDTA